MRRAETTAFGCTVTTEPGRITVSDPERCLVYELTGDAPVQAFGTIIGRDLYFRARWDGWSFEVADHRGRLPSDGSADPDGFCCEGRYGSGEFAASYLPLDVAMRIIDRCVRAYVEGPIRPG